jgi:hypothetical protein
MSTLDDVTKSNAELGGMVKSVASGQSSGSMRSSVSKNYNKTVDTHIDTSDQMHEKLKHLMKEYAELKREYYGKYASISDTDNDARVTKFNKQVNDFWDYDDYVRKEKEDYRVASTNWNRESTDLNRWWKWWMNVYNDDNEQFKESRRVRHNEALGMIRTRGKTANRTVIEYYVNDYIARRNELFSADTTMSNWYMTNAVSSNPYWAKVKRWEKAGYSVTMPAQRVGVTAVLNNKKKYEWTMGGSKADTWSGTGSWWNNAPWNGSFGGDNSLTDGSVIWYGHGPSYWPRANGWIRWANLGYGSNARPQENWGKQPLNVPYVFYTTFFVDPQGPTTGHMYGWCDNECRVYVNNVDVYDRVIRGGSVNKGKWNWNEGTKQNKPNNKSDPIKLNKGFNMIAVVAVNKGGPAGMSWTMWNDPKYWDGVEVDIKPTFFGNYDTEKTGILVRTDATWRCVLQNVKAPKLTTYHTQATKEPYSDTNLSLPGFIQNDSALVQEFQPSNMKKFKAAKGVRYVRVVADGKQCMQIAQLAVYAMDNQGKNIAKGKPTDAKDVYNNGKNGSTPDKAVDGQLKAKAYPNIYHSACKKDPWWQVDLGAVHNIAKIVYYNRGDCCRSRANKLKLQFMDADKKVLWTGDEFGSSAAEQTFAFGDADLTIEAAPTLPTIHYYNTENITVGSSGSNVKTVALPRENMYISGVPVNPQKVTWSDSFTASVSGKTLTVRRTDTRGGWSQDLVLRTVTNPQEKPVPPVIMPQVWPGLDAYQTPQLALLEKISAKSHEIIKMSEKVHLQYAAVAKNKDLTMFGTQRDNAYKGLTSRYMSMLEERQIVEDAITEFDSVRAEQLSSELSVDTSRLIYWTWGVTAAALVVLIMLYVAAPKMGGVVKGEISSIFVIVACVALLTTFLGQSHLILPTCIMIVFLVLYYLYRRGKSGGGSSAPDIGSIVAPAAV